MQFEKFRNMILDTEYRSSGVTPWLWSEKIPDILWVAKIRGGKVVGRIYRVEISIDEDNEEAFYVGTVRKKNTAEHKSLVDCMRAANTLIQSEYQGS